MTTLSNEQKTRELEALLFAYGNEVTFETLLTVLDCDQNRLDELIGQLTADTSSPEYIYEPYRTNSTVGLMLKSAYTELIKRAKIAQEGEQLTKTQMECLAIIGYQNGASKSEVDTIRGVNSGQTLRGLLMRGLIEKTGTSHGSTVFGLTAETLQYLGIKHTSELTKYEMLKSATTELLDTGTVDNPTD